MSKSKKKHKKTSIKSNLDIWDAHQIKPPELPSLHPLERTIMSKTKFNSIYQYTQTFQRRLKPNKLKTRPTNMTKNPNLSNIYLVNHRNSDQNSTSNDEIRQWQARHSFNDKLILDYQ